jgi:hypothetical protein
MLYSPDIKKFGHSELMGEVNKETLVQENRKGIRAMIDSLLAGG